MPEQTTTNEVEVGQRFPLTIKRIGINGEGIGYYKRKIVFIPGALPEEVVIAEVTTVAPASSKLRSTRFVKNHHNGSHLEMPLTVKLVGLNWNISVILANSPLKRI